MTMDGPDSPSFLSTMRARRTELRETVARLRRELAQAKAESESVSRAIRAYSSKPKDTTPKGNSAQSAGGIARSLMMSPEERSRQASLAAKARWAKAKETPPE